MFNAGFYPTPRELANKVYESVKMKNFEQVYILDPSAGKGDLLAPAAWNKQAKLHACEIEPELQAILREKKISVVASDFLSYKPHINYDYIVMNPPFDAGARHLLHAWHIADGTHIVCILNAETIRNAHTQERQNLAELIRLNNGTVEFVKNAFVAAERRTGVEIAIIRLYKPQSEKTVFGFQNLQQLKSEAVSDKEETIKDVTNPNFIKNSVYCFNKSVESLKLLFDAFAQMKFYAPGCGIDFKDFFWSFRMQSEVPLKIISGQKSDFNAVVEEMTKKAWDDIFAHKPFQKLITSATRAAFEREQQQRGVMAYNEENISNLVDILIQGRGHAMQKTLEACFDTICAYNKKNIIYKEGWKTNSHYKVNRKMILPVFDNWINTYEWKNFFIDLDKALAYLQGKNIEQLSKLTTDVLFDNNRKNDDVIESDFFSIKVYMKGTAHLTFKDESLWARFNQAAADGKNWLG